MVNDGTPEADMEELDKREEVSESLLYTCSRTLVNYAGINGERKALPRPHLQLGHYSPPRHLLLVERGFLRIDAFPPYVTID